MARMVRAGDSNAYWNHVAINKDKEARAANPDILAYSEEYDHPLSDVFDKAKKMILTLKPRHQEIVWLYFYERRSQRVIAATLGLSRWTVRGHLKRALKKLKAMLVKDGILN